MYSGPHIKRDGLVFGYDTGRNPSSNFDHRINKRRHFRGKPTVNFFPDGHFPNGTDMASEAGSNSQNDVVLLNNPGNSPYVLRQSMGVASTEYQINLTTELSANTTYCMSGWYAESGNYSGSSRMFHARANSSSGAHRSTGAGVYNVIKTKRVGGLLWKFAFYTITTPSDYNNNFNWYVGYLNQSYTGYRYYTNLKLEQGTRPTPYHTGTRSSTQSLIDLTKSTNIDVSNVSFDSNGLPEMDGTDDYVDLGSDLAISPINQGWTAEYVFNTDSASTLQHFNGCEEDTHNAGWLALLNSKLAVWDRGANVWKYGNTVFTSNTWYYIAFVQESGTSMQFYVNGVAEGGDHSSFSWTASKSAFFARYIGRYEYNGGYSRYFNGHIPVAKFYNKPLTSKEIKQNFKAYKTRFDI